MNISRIAMSVVVVAALSVCWGCTKPTTQEANPPQEASREAILEETLSYLSTLEDVAWVHFDGNNVYVGFTRRPDDLDMVLRAAALKGNRAIDFGVHVWGIPADEPRGSVDRVYGEASARYGKIKN